MGIVIVLHRHIPASLFLTYTDERNPKMFHGCNNLCPPLIDKLAWGGQLYGGQRGLSLQGLSAAAAPPMCRTPVAGDEIWCLEKASYLRLHSHFGFPLAGFLV